MHAIVLHITLFLIPFVLTACYLQQVLIQDYDHLCPWTGTGIGRKNMLAFKVFLVGINVLCYFSVILVIIALLRGLRF
jgi:hypothetical protein